MTREQLNAEFQKALAEKEALSAVVDPLRVRRDAVVARMQPLEQEAREIAEQIKGHLPRLAEVDQRLSRLARALGHPRVGGVPNSFRR